MLEDGSHEAENDQELSRRDFIRNAAVGAVGAVGAVALTGIMQKEALSAEPPKAAISAPSTPAAPIAKPAVLTLDSVLKSAREKLYPFCRVCPECDGVACAGEVPGWVVLVRANRSRTTTFPCPRLN